MTHIELSFSSAQCHVHYNENIVYSYSMCTWTSIRQTSYRSLFPNPKIILSLLSMNGEQQFDIFFVQSASSTGRYKAFPGEVRKETSL